jgi:hypothetical protein
VPLSDRAVVRNLAQLNQWFRKNSTMGDRIRFLRRYGYWRNEYELSCAYGRRLGLSFAELVQALAEAAFWHAERLGAQRDRRIHRDGRYFARLRLGGGWRALVYLQSKQSQDESRASRTVFSKAWWRDQLRDPRRWLSGENCKNSHTAVVARALLRWPDAAAGQDPPAPDPAPPSAGLPVIVKHPRARNWRRRLAQLLPPSRSLRGWRTGYALLHRDNATARPLAVVERRLGPFVLDSLLITECVPGGIDLETHLARESAALAAQDWFRRKRVLCALLVRLIRRLQERGFAHRDCKAGNILVVPLPRLKLLWIDMDGLRRVGPPSPAERLAPLARLHVSLLASPGLTRTDRARFLKAYLARFGADPRAWRRLWPELERLAEKKLLATQAHRAWKLAHYGRP